MAKRARPAVTAASTPYFVGDKEGLQFVSTGCTKLDCDLGGGLVLGRMANIVGDKSTAKTGLACEIVTNFVRKYPKGRAAYRDSESAFDQQYAQAMGLPVDKVDFGDKRVATVEDFARDLDSFITECGAKDLPGIYVIDSYDALSDEAELEREFGEATYGANKAKAGSEMFRKLVGKVEGSKVLLLIISQVRDNINAKFGEKYKRSGGHALDFYATHIIWLSHVETLKRTIKKVERPVGILIKAKVKKNKVGVPFREAEFPFMFGYGIDDLYASFEWLKEVARLDDIDIDPKTSVKEYLKQLEGVSDDDYFKEVKRAATAVRVVWREIETTFLPSRRKYG